VIDRSVTRDDVRPSVERRAGRRRIHIHRIVCVVCLCDFFELEKRATRSRTRARGCATGRDARAVRGRGERDAGARGERRDGDARVGDGVGGGVGVGETRGRPRGADASVWIVVDRGEGCDGDVCRSRENVDARARAS
jgi:hypothetical protein